MQVVVAKGNGVNVLNRGVGRPSRCLQPDQDNTMANGSAAMFEESCTEPFQQRAEFLPLHNRGLGPLAVTVLPVALARRAAGTRMPLRCLIGWPAQSTLTLSSGSCGRGYSAT